MRLAFLTLGVMCVAACASTPLRAEIEPLKTEQAVISCAERAQASESYIVSDAEWDERMAQNSQRLEALGFSAGENNTPTTHKKPETLQSPMPTFPFCAAERGLEGYCYVHFDVDDQGQTKNVFPRCTHKIFETSAATAVRRATFKPATVNGKAVEYPGIVYPMNFKLEQ